MVSKSGVNSSLDVGFHLFSALMLIKCLVFINAKSTIITDGFHDSPVSLGMTPIDTGVIPKLKCIANLLFGQRLAHSKKHVRDCAGEARIGCKNCQGDQDDEKDVLDDRLSFFFIHQSVFQNLILCVQ